MAEQTPREKADAAAEALAAEGLDVTARAVRERAGVRMTVAVEAAREWGQQQTAAVTAPDVPDVVATRFEAIWREAWQAARAEFDAERAGLAAKVAAAAEERDRLVNDIEHLEAERDQAAQQAEALRTKLTAAEQTHAAALKEAENRATGAEGLAAGLREALAALAAKQATSAADDA